MMYIGLCCYLWFIGIGIVIKVVVVGWWWVWMIGIFFFVEDFFIFGDKFIFFLILVEVLVDEESLVGVRVLFLVFVWLKLLKSYRLECVY